MNQAIALIATLVLLSLNGLGNFWFTYGIWPKSWIAYSVFFVTGMILSTMLNQVLKSEK